MNLNSRSSFNGLYLQGGEALDGRRTVQEFGRLPIRRFWLDDVRCTGSETTLKNCLSLDWGKENCHRGEEAGVICSEFYLSMCTYSSSQN